MDNMTYAMCNSGPGGNKIRFPLEERLKILSTNSGCFVCGIFDCCREKITEAMRGSRGSFGDAPLDALEDDKANHIFWFGCEPNRGVSAKSTIAVEFFNELKERALPESG